ncbi:MAG: c-type cytochrome [Anaerolineae bacterium]|nr:c-type cytochrome [Anaerolineae bacterium]
MMLLAVLVAGCIQTSSEPEIVATRLVEAPRPPQTFDLQAGAAVYAQWCVQCHGTEGRGDGETAAAFTCQLPNFPERPTNVTLASWYNTVHNGNGGEPSCLMPPWNQRLNTTQMWDVTAYISSLSYENSLLETGQNLTEAAKSNENAFNFANTRWQADTSDAAILTGLSGNGFEGYTFPTALSDEEKQAVLLYIRSQVYTASPAEVAAVNTPAPVTTEEPADESAVTVTEEPADLAITPIPLVPVASETFTLTGNVVNGTEDGTLPTDLTIRLRVVALDASGQPSTVYDAETALGEGSSFTFADVPRSERALASLETQYAGLRQFAPQFAPASVEGDTFELEFPVYETTTDSSVVTISYMEMLIDAVTMENASLTFHTFEITNTSDRVFMGSDGKTVQLRLPADVLSPEVDALGNFEGRFTVQQDGNEFLVTDTAPLFPGTTRIGATYGKEYDGSMEMSQTFSYPVLEAGIFVSQSRGLEVESDQLSPREAIDFNNNTYSGYGLSNITGLPACSTLTFRVSDGPNTARTLDTAADEDEGKSFLQENVTLILGLGVLLILAGGMFMFYDLQKTRLAAQQASGSRPIPTTRKAIIAQIAELDAAYEAGEIDEKSYESEREELKAALRKQMK